MSVVAEQTYKTCYGDNRDWFTNTAKDKILQYEIDSLRYLKQNNTLSGWYAPTILELIPNKCPKQKKAVFAVVNSTTQEEASSQFLRLATEWKESIRVISDWNLMILHPSYQRIIGLGPDVIPLILKELKLNGGHWFWALQALTGENPITNEDAGRVKKMTEAWLAWGSDKGYI
jgi:hypothetical protein